VDPGECISRMASPVPPKTAILARMAPTPHRDRGHPQLGCRQVDVYDGHHADGSLCPPGRRRRLVASQV